MAKKKNTPRNQQTANNGIQTAEDLARSLYHMRSLQFPKAGSDMREVFEGLDFDQYHVKRRVASSLALLDEVQAQFQTICPDVPGIFSLMEDWITINSYPISAYDYVENRVHSALGAAIWILDQIRDTGKLQELATILSVSPVPQPASLPPVWDACHHPQLLATMVAIIRNRNTDHLSEQKPSSKRKSGLFRCYMDKYAAENKINHSASSRILFDRILKLIHPDDIALLKHRYEEKYWDWLKRYFLCRAIFVKEEQHIRSEIEAFHRRSQQILPLRQPAPSLAVQTIPDMRTSGLPSHMANAKDLAFQNEVLYRLQENFNSRFEAFSREVGEFSLLPYDNLAAKYGPEIAECWAGFELNDPYALCAAFLFLLEDGSDLPWCYFAGIHLQSCYVSMLPWTRTRYADTCDNIWQHWDSQAAAVVPGPGTDPLPKKIKIPDPDNWYQMKYTDSSVEDPDWPELYNLSHVIYEITGCIMPRNLERHKAALETLSRYGINSKKANQYLSYCIALLGEAKHQSSIYGPSLPTAHIGSGSADDLTETIRSLQAENNRYKQAAQAAEQQLHTMQNQLSKLEEQASRYKQEISDLGRLLFRETAGTASPTIHFPYKTVSRVVIYGGSGQWLTEMKAMLPGIAFYDHISTGHANILRKADMIWLQADGMPHWKYKEILQESRKYSGAIRYFSGTDANACAIQLAQADIESC